jgi:hypothetical protein
MRQGKLNAQTPAAAASSSGYHATYVIRPVSIHRVFLEYMTSLYGYFLCAEAKKQFCANMGLWAPCLSVMVESGSEGKI